VIFVADKAVDSPIPVQASIVVNGGWVAANDLHNICHWFFLKEELDSQEPLMYGKQLVLLLVVANNFLDLFDGFLQLRPLDS